MVKAAQMNPSHLKTIASSTSPHKFPDIKSHDHPVSETTTPVSAPDLTERLTSNPAHVSIPSAPNTQSYSDTEYLENNDSTAKVPLSFLLLAPQLPGLRRSVRQSRNPRRDTPLLLTHQTTTTCSISSQPRSDTSHPNKTPLGAALIPFLLFLLFFVSHPSSTFSGESAKRAQSEAFLFFPFFSFFSLRGQALPFLLHIQSTLFLSVCWSYHLLLGIARLLFDDKTTSFLSILYSISKNPLKVLSLLRPLLKQPSHYHKRNRQPLFALSPQPTETSQHGCQPFHSVRARYLGCRLVD
ncbi:hypothetical protein CC79DRAFT_6252 [Sarocladium strictum]